MEPRMRPRPKGPQFPPGDLSALLTAFGDTSHPPGPLPATVAVLDTIITDFIIETCHEAAFHATYAGRAKVKQDDFQWALRKDYKKLGRVRELMALERDLRDKRKAFDVEEAGPGAAVGEDGEALEGGEKKKVGRGRGRRKKVKTEETSELADSAVKNSRDLEGERKGEEAVDDDVDVDALFGGDDD